jgi:hypothetical protein
VRCGTLLLIGTKAMGIPRRVAVADDNWHALADRVGATLGIAGGDVTKGGIEAYVGSHAVL